MHHIRLVSAHCFVVVGYICSHTGKAVFISENAFHAAHRLFACRYIFRCSAFVGAEFIIGFDGFGLLFVERHTSQAGYVLDIHGDTIAHGLAHGVFIHHSAEHVNAVVGGGAGKAHVCGIRQRIAQICCKAASDESAESGGILVLRGQFGSFQFGTFGRVVDDTQFRAEIVLGAVCFIAEADDVRAVGEQAGCLAKFLNGADEYAAGAAVSKLSG